MVSTSRVVPVSFQTESTILTRKHRLCSSRLLFPSRKAGQTGQPSVTGAFGNNWKNKWNAAPTSENLVHLMQKVRCSSDRSNSRKCKESPKALGLNRVRTRILTISTSQLRRGMINTARPVSATPAWFSSLYCCRWNSVSRTMQTFTDSPLSCLCRIMINDDWIPLGCHGFRGDIVHSGSYHTVMVKVIRNTCAFPAII